METIQKRLERYSFVLDDLDVWFREIDFGMVTIDRMRNGKVRLSKINLLGTADKRHEFDTFEAALDCYETWT